MSRHQTLTHLWHLWCQVLLLIEHTFVARESMKKDASGMAHGIRIPWPKNSGATNAARTTHFWMEILWPGIWILSSRNGRRVAFIRSEVICWQRLQLADFQDPWLRLLAKSKLCWRDTSGVIATDCFWHLATHWLLNNISCVCPNLGEFV